MKKFNSTANGYDDTEAANLTLVNSEDDASSQHLSSGDSYQGDGAAELQDTATADKEADSKQR